MKNPQFGDFPDYRSPAAPKPKKPKKPKKPMSFFGKFMIFTVCILPIAFVVGWFNSQQAAKGPSPEELSLQAQWACEGAVEQNLKAPATAKHSEQSVQGSKPKWTVTGSVDAENTFGALIRTSYSCEVVLQSNRMVATLESLG